MSEVVYFKFEFLLLQPSGVASQSRVRKKIVSLIFFQRSKFFLVWEKKKSPGPMPTPTPFRFSHLRRKIPIASEKSASGWSWKGTLFWCIRYRRHRKVIWENLTRRFLTIKMVSSSSSLSSLSSSSSLSSPMPMPHFSHFYCIYKTAPIKIFTNTKIFGGKARNVDFAAKFFLESDACVDPFLIKFFQHVIGVRL